MYLKRNGGNFHSRYIFNSGYGCARADSVVYGLDVCFEIRDVADAIPGLFYTKDIKMILSASLAPKMCPNGIHMSICDMILQ